MKYLMGTMAAGMAVAAVNNLVIYEEGTVAAGIFFIAAAIFFTVTAVKADKIFK